MYIISNKSTYISAKVLAKFITNKTGEKFYATTDISKYPSICWGNSFANPGTNLNDPKLIKISSNKRLFSNLMTDKNIPCLEIHSGTPDKFPVVVRTVLSGSKGKGIIICEDEEQFLQYTNFYWTYWYDFKFELGVHVLEGEIKKVFKKISESNDEKYPIKNADRGYHYSLVDTENYPKLQYFVKSIFDIFPIEFARFDIGWDYNNHTYRVIESNSAPGLSNNENTLELYGEFLAKKIIGE